MPKSLTLGQVGAMFAQTPAERRSAIAPPPPDLDGRPTVLRVTPCVECGGDVLTVLPDDPEDIRPLRFICSACSNF